MKHYILIFNLLLFQIIFSQQCDEVKSFSIIKEVVNEISGDDYEGRKTGEMGGEKAAIYIKNYLKNLFKEDNNVDIYSQTFEFFISKNPHLKTKDVKKNAENIICFIDNKQSETVIIGAHYDHLGYGDFGSLYASEQSLIHNGADDNASGVALGLSLMHSLYHSSKMYNYLFIAFDGEEMGLYGSSFFCKNPTLDFKNVRFMINFDMVGRLNDNKDLAINGVGTSSHWSSLINKINEEYQFQLILSESGVGPSDHSSFYYQNIPAIHFFTGQHTDYHKPTDDSDKINYKGIQDLLCFVKDMIQKSSSIENFDFQETKNNTNNTPSFSVTLGVMPDYLFTGKGMKIDGVSKDKTAFKAGVVKGDIVVRMGNVDVIDMMTYMEALSLFKKGDTTSIQVLRSGQLIDLIVNFQ